MAASRCNPWKMPQARVQRVGLHGHFGRSLHLSWRSHRTKADGGLQSTRASNHVHLDGARREREGRTVHPYLSVDCFAQGIANNWYARKSGVRRKPAALASDMHPVAQAARQLGRGIRVAFVEEACIVLQTCGTRWQSVTSSIPGGCWLVKEGTMVAF
jgi:hypothetical protein